MAKVAPESIKAFAEEKGIDLAAMLEQIGQKGNGAMQNQGMSLLSSYTQEDNSVTALLEALMDKSESDENSG
jgi:hypothetical protein